MFVWLIFQSRKGIRWVVWKKKIPDLHLLSKNDYEYLMDKVDEVRNGMVKTLGIKKVYLMYMDEVSHVHWHLIHKFNIKGFNLLKHRPSKLKDFSLASKIRENLASLK